MKAYDSLNENHHLRQRSQASQPVRGVLRTEGILLHLRSGQRKPANSFLSVMVRRILRESSVHFPKKEEER